MWRGLGRQQTQRCEALRATRHRAMASRAQPLEGVHWLGLSRETDPQALRGVNREGSTHAVWVQGLRTGGSQGARRRAPRGTRGRGRRSGERHLCCSAGRLGSACLFRRRPHRSHPESVCPAAWAFRAPSVDTQEPPRRLCLTVVSQLCPHQDNFHEGLTHGARVCAPPGRPGLGTDLPG